MSPRAEREHGSAQQKRAIPLRGWPGISRRIKNEVELNRLSIKWWAWAESGQPARLASGQAEARLQARGRGESSLKEHPGKPASLELGERLPTECRPPARRERIPSRPHRGHLRRS